MKTKSRLYNMAQKDGRPNSGPDYTGTRSEVNDFFCLKQLCSNGYVRYSSIRHEELEKPETIEFSICPNPLVGIVGIKFDNSLGG